MNTKISEFTDRELLEIILSNQVTMMQLIDRMDAFLCGKYGADYVAKVKDKETIFNGLFENQDDLLMQMS